MALRIPTTQEVFDRNLANLESAINQTAPLTPKAFLRVFSAMEAMAYTELNRLAVERARQNFAMTAGAEGLAIIGEEHGVTRKAASAAQLTIRATADPDTEVTMDSSFIGDSNSARYTPDAGASESGGYISLDVTASVGGIAGNLAVDDTLTIDTEIEGVGTSWYVMGVVTIGLDEEDLESWRRRILTEIRTVGGGGNLADYRTWAEQTPGCYRAFPYSSAPTGTIDGFEDGDMEDPTLDAWTTYGTVTKSVIDPYEGLRCLRVGSGEGPGYAGQAVLVVGRQYTITGVARSDAGENSIPRIRTGNGLLIWAGEADADWQEIDASFIADDTSIRLMSGEGETGLGYECYYDDIDITEAAVPAARTVYVEAEPELDEDGIADQDLLDDVREYINTDPDTTKARPPLGMTDETLYVESITRTTLNVEIRDLVIDSALEAAAKTRIEEILDEYFRACSPHIVGLDPQFAKDDIITSLTVSRVVQDYLETQGASAGGIGIYLVADTFIPSYALGAGELAKLGVVTYV